MPWALGEIRCANCTRPEDEHCQTCGSCDGEPVRECCMEGWPEKLKVAEREWWAKRGRTIAPSTLATTEPREGTDG